MKQPIQFPWASWGIFLHHPELRRHCVQAPSLLDGVDADSRDTDGRTSLSWAAWTGHEAVVKLLLVKGANPDFKDNYGQTPLSRAAEKGEVAAVKLLLAESVDADSKDNDGRTPLLMAEIGYEAVVKLRSRRSASTRTPRITTVGRRYHGPQRTEARR
jgi:ankyrin repeat protein